MLLRQWVCSGQMDVVNDKDDVSNVLRMPWCRSRDTLRFNTMSMELPQILTKRIVLSLVQRIFDPLGIIYPITLALKILLQQT